MHCRESESRSVVSSSLPPHGLYSPWNSPGQNTGVGSLSFRGSSQPRDRTQISRIAHSLPAEPQGKPKNTGVSGLFPLQGIFQTQELNQGLLHCRQILYQLSHQGSLVGRMWIKARGLALEGGAVWGSSRPAWQWPGRASIAGWWSPGGAWVRLPLSSLSLALGRAVTVSTLVLHMGTHVWMGPPQGLHSPAQHSSESLGSWQHTGEP